MSTFAKVFQKATQSPRPVPHGGVALTDLDPHVAVHYGIPPSASILAFDPFQRLLAIGTLDGRIKIIGGDNIEGFLLSPKQLPFKNLEFLQNQGFLASVSNENEVQVWDLEQRCLACNLQWVSNITAFSVICGTSFMYIGDEYGLLAVLKYDAETRKLLQLQYCLPANLVTEAAGISVSNHQSIVGLLPQPNSFANRVLIAYENGLIILWDVYEDRAVVVRGYKDLLLKEDGLDSVNDSVQDEQSEKEISSLSWVTSDGSIVAVGYVDGDILLWNLSDSASRRDQKGPKSSNNVVKLQLSSGDRRLPVIVLHWCKRKTHDDSGGNLFVYGGDEIGSEEVLTILNLDWSSGIESLRCVGRVDLTLNGSFADMILVPNAGATRQCETSSLFVLSNPGQLHFYDDSCLCSLMDHPEKKHSIPGVQYLEVVPTLEPFMTSAKLKFVCRDRSLSRSTLMTGTTTKHGLAHSATKHTKWPITGGVPCQLSCAQDDDVITRVYIAGYQDGSVRVWDGTFPVLSPIFVLGSEIEGIEIVGANAPVSALEFFSSTSMLAIGNDFGLIRLYKLGSGSEDRSLHVVTETAHEVHNLHGENGAHFTAVFSVQNSSVCTLQFVDFGNRLAVGFASGCVALFDVSSSSVLFLTESLFDSSSSFIFLSIITTPSNANNLVPLEDKTCESTEKAIFILTGDTHIAVVHSTTGKVISSRQIHRQKLPAISMHILDGSGFSEVSCERPPLISYGDPEVKSEPIKMDVDQSSMDSLLLLCFEDALKLCSIESLIKGEYKPIHEVKLEKPYSYTAIFKKDGKEAGLILIYQTGLIEIRSLPYLQLVGESSLMSILRWSFKTSMSKTICSSDTGQIVLVNGGEVAFISLFAFENDFRIPQTLPCLHDKVLEAATEAASFSQNQKKQASLPGVLGGIIKGFKGNKGENREGPTEDPVNLLAHLDAVFSRIPLSGSSTTISDDQEVIYLNIDDIDIDEPAPTPSFSQKIKIDKKGADKGTDREKLFQGGTSSTVTEPRMRTAEEIKAKYRKTVDASGAASEAKDKLLERGEKLEKLSRRTEELQNGAQNFAELANELVKTMEKRNKWWNI